ncbi:hypothetical protein [Moraxella oblonga]|uniref:hypothetical protein n=1 Tax=Moraxella oblonga TaxID=200413 RepID=UPI0008370192|nr:hypothetical protein [Moraxella oblonga]
MKFVKSMMSVAVLAVVMTGCTTVSLQDARHDTTMLEQALTTTQQNLDEATYQAMVVQNAEQAVLASAKADKQALKAQKKAERARKKAERAQKRAEKRALKAQKKAERAESRAKKASIKISQAQEVLSQ